MNQISTMMLMGSPAVIYLDRHGQQHSWELVFTPIYFLHNKYMQEILSKKMEYLIHRLSGLPKPHVKIPSIIHDERSAVFPVYIRKTRLNHFCLERSCQRLCLTFYLIID